jgi:hypothetical protein
MEQVKPADLDAIANLTREAIVQQRPAAELTARAEERRGEGARVRLAQASRPAHLIWRGGDAERSIPRIVTALHRAPAAGIQPASHRCSPRIAADPRASRLISHAIYFRHRLEACATEELRPMFIGTTQSRT